MTTPIQKFLDDLQSAICFYQLGGDKLAVSQIVNTVSEHYNLVQQDCNHAWNNSNLHKTTGFCEKCLITQKEYNSIKKESL